MEGNDDLVLGGSDLVVEQTARLIEDEVEELFVKECVTSLVEFLFDGSLIVIIGEGMSH